MQQLSSPIFSCKSNTHSNYNLFPAQKTQGSDVGYKYVSQQYVDSTGHFNGKKLFTFRSPIDYPNEEKLSSHIPINPINNQEFLRGQLVREQTMNNTGEILHEKNIEYASTEYEKQQGVKIKDNFQNSPIKKFFDYTTYPQFEMHIGNIALSTIYTYFDKFGISLPIRVTETYYSNSGLQSNETTTTYIYNANDYPTEVKQVFQDGGESVSLTKYATETSNTSLISANMIGIPLVTETKVANTGHSQKTVSKTETEYENKLPKRVKSYPFESAVPVEEMRFDSYDDRGNPTQYTVRGIQPVAIVWGYNKTQPIAKIEGANYSDIASMSVLSEMITASDADATATANTSTEATLLIKQKAFRQALPGYMVTTYTYDPLIGVTNVTQPSGLREQYIYNQNTNQLEMVVDAEGKVLKQFKYNYKH